MNELEKIWDCGIDLPYREKVEKLQETIAGLEGVEAVKEGENVLYPSWTKYNHYFSDGLYIREMFCPKGYLAL